jgi:pimeloyl-ACP methyl ester carboxylesterase
MIQERTIDAGGFDTRYLESRPDGEPEATVVLIHEGAIGADARTCWSGVMPLLAEQGYRVLAPDLLGYGDSAKVVYLDRQPYDFRITHLAEFCAAVGADSAHFAGHSFGGSLVLRALASPSPRLRARSGVSISGSGGPWRTPAATQELGRFDGTEDDIRRMLAIMVDEFPGFDENVRLRYANTRKPGHVEACLALRLKHPAPIAKPAGRPWPEGLYDCPVPVMVVAGESDVLLDTDWTDHFQPPIEVQRLDGKHAPNIDRPEVVASLLTRFFAGSLRATAS